MQNIVIKTTDTFVSKTLRFPINYRPRYPITLKRMSYKARDLIKHTEISSIVQTKFNDGNLAFIINIAHVAEKNDKQFELYRANLILKIKKNQVLQLTNNGKLVTKGFTIAAILGLFNKVADNYKDAFDDYPEKSYNLFDYYFSRNQKLLQLPCKRKFLESFYFSLDQNNRNRINYHLRKGNTHKATIALLGYDFPKSIRKVLLSDSRYAFHRKTLKLALEAGIPVDTIRSLMLQRRFKLISLLAKKPTLTGWSLKEVQRKFDEDFQDFLTPRKDEYPSEVLARDIVNMIKPYYRIESLPEIDITYMPSNIHKLHDQVVLVYNRLMDSAKAQDWISKNKYHDSEYPVVKINDYIIRPVVNSNECLSIGYDMHICVGSYIDDHSKGNLEILVVTDSKGKYLACLELREYTLVQAKLKYNKFISRNKDISQAVADYCNQFDINISTRDMV